MRRDDMLLWVVLIAKDVEKIQQKVMQLLERRFQRHDWLLVINLGV